MRCDNCQCPVRATHLGSPILVDWIYGSTYCFPAEPGIDERVEHISETYFVAQLTPEFGTGKARRIFRAYRILEAAADMLASSEDPVALRNEAHRYALAMLTVPGKGI